MYVTRYKDIVFIEGEYSAAQVLEHVEVKIKGIFVNAQSKTLDDVKEKIVESVMLAGGNGIIKFKYGQRSNLLGSFFNRDDVEWYGTGVIVKLSEEQIASLQK